MFTATRRRSSSSNGYRRAVAKLPERGGEGVPRRRGASAGAGPDSRAARPLEVERLRSTPHAACTRAAAVYTQLLHRGMWLYKAHCLGQPRVCMHAIASTAGLGGCGGALRWHVGSMAGDSSRQARATRAGFAARTTTADWHSTQGAAGACGAHVQQSRRADSCHSIASGQEDSTPPAERGSQEAGRDGCRRLVDGGRNTSCQKHLQAIERLRNLPRRNVRAWTVTTGDREQPPVSHCTDGSAVVLP